DFLQSDWLEARILERRLPGIVGDIEDERPLWQQRATAAAQLTFHGDGDEGRALGFQHARQLALKVELRRRSAMKRRLFHHLACEVQENAAGTFVELSRVGIFEGK